MCPLEVQAGQLSVENKLLPCFQTLWQPNYNPQHTRPIPNLTLHPSLVSAPCPLVLNVKRIVKLPRGKMEGGATAQAQALNTCTFRLTINWGRRFYN